jgi:simple sugar transport system permease protein
MTGWGGFVFSITLGALLGTLIGYGYALLLNRLKGQEMAVSTYVGFSFVALMCVFWMLLPFHNPLLTWALGSGLRLTHNMNSSFGMLLNNFLAFEAFGITVPTGLYLFLALCCTAMWLFLRSKTGLAMSAAGANPRFAEATGINVDRMRIVGTVLSTAIAAIGIVVYSQGYGFMQLYNAPRQMGFIAASAILIGGASVQRAKISHVVIGCFLFQGILALGMPVANALVPQGNISEVMRILISNGIILYALTKSGGELRD